MERLELGAARERHARSVLALTVYDDGGGSKLYAGGSFTIAGGGAASRIAKWNGSSWSGLGSPLDNTVHALAVVDLGAGPALYAGGAFTTAGGMSANRIARWNGTSWAPLGSGTNGSVLSLAMYDEGGGPALFAGGTFTTAGGVAANRIAKWNGSSWTALGNGAWSDVTALAVHDDGSGSALYAGITSPDGGEIRRWNGSSWTTLGNLGCEAMAVYGECGAASIYAGGSFEGALRGIARLDGASWSNVGSGINAESVTALGVHDGGGGPALYVGGDFFSSAGGVAVNRIAKWDGSGWSALGSGVEGTVWALTEFDDGSGPALYAGGSFTHAGGVVANRIAKWNGSSWSALGSGMNSFSYVYALAVYDDGGGPALYAAGSFTTAGGVAANRIAKWNGSSWSALGSGLGGGSTTLQVRALATFDDGSGPALYAGGLFTSAGGAPANHVARWDGSTWSPLGSGVDSIVYALAVYDDGSGPALYAGGRFATAGGAPAASVAKWNGSSWSTLGSGMGPGRSVLGLAVYDAGLGPELCAGGTFFLAGGVAVRFMAKWDGSTWSPLGSGMDDRYVWPLVVYDDGTGPALYAGGAFQRALDSGDSLLARWGCPDTTSPVLSCPSSVTALDGSFDRQEVVTFTVTATDDLDPSPDVACMPPSGSTFPLGTTLVDCTATDASGNQSSCQFPVTVVPKARRR